MKKLWAENDSVRLGLSIGVFLKSAESPKRKAFRFRKSAHFIESGKPRHFPSTVCRGALTISYANAPSGETFSRRDLPLF